MIGIYKIENLINGKIYIGQSVDIHERWLEHKRINNRENEKVAQSYPLYQAFKKYGLENFSFEVIEECKREQLDEKEQYWINYYHSFIHDPQSHGYNLTLGGQGFNNITEEEINIFIDLWNQGLSVGQISEKTKRNNHAVIQYLKQYCSSYSVEEGSKRGCKLSGAKHRKAINQYDLLGNFIAHYDSIQDAAKAINGSINGVGRNASFQTKMYKNYYFIYDNENQKEGLIKHITQPRNVRPVLQMDFNHNILNVFVSAAEAERALLGYQGGGVNMCCLGKAQSAYGFYWKYLELADCNLERII